MTGDLQSLSGPRLESLIERLSNASRAALADSIAAGYGDLTMREIRQRAAAGCPIAARVIDSHDAEHVARAELARRRTWHGGNQPIKRRA